MRVSFSSGDGGGVLWLVLPRLGMVLYLIREVCTGLEVFVQRVRHQDR